MTRTRKSAVVALGFAVSFCAFLPAAASAQISPDYPRNNVRGGALAARRPGGWIQDGIATHVQRQDLAFGAFGGAEITQVGPEPSIRDAVLPALVDVFLGVVQQLSLVIQALIQGGTLPALGV